MKRNKVIFYSTNDMEFIRLEFKPKKPYSMKYLNSLVGFELTDGANITLHNWGYLRVCNDLASWRKHK